MSNQNMNELSTKHLLYGREGRTKSCPKCGQKSFSRQYSLGGQEWRHSRARRGHIRGVHYYCHKCHYSETQYEDGVVIKRMNRLETENSHATYMALIQVEKLECK